MRHEERLLEELRRELRGLSTTQALAYLLREGLLDLRRAEEAAIRRDVAPVSYTHLTLPTTVPV